VKGNAFPYPPEDKKSKSDLYFLFLKESRVGTVVRFTILTLAFGPRLAIQRGRPCSTAARLCGQRFCSYGKRATLQLSYGNRNECADERPMGGSTGIASGPRSRNTLPCSRAAQRLSRRMCLPIGARRARLAWLGRLDERSLRRSASRYSACQKGACERVEPVA
jgi:hypothetical protein